MQRLAFAALISLAGLAPAQASDKPSAACLEWFETVNTGAASKGYGAKPKYYCECMENLASNNGQSFTSFVRTMDAPDSRRAWGCFKDSARFY